MSVCAGAKKVVRTVYGNSGSFEVQVGVHRGSALGPLQFVIVMGTLSVSSELPCSRSCCGQVAWLSWLRLRVIWLKGLVGGWVAWRVEVWGEYE